MPIYALDARFENNLSGIGRDTRYFYEALSSLLPNQISINKGKSVSHKFAIPDLIWFKSQLGLSELVKDASIDYFFQSHIWNIRVKSSTRRIVRVHDVFPITNPEWFRKSSVNSFRKAFNLLSDKDLILADSLFTATKIKNLNPRLNVRVLHCKTPSLEDFACTGCDVCTKTMLPSRFFLCVNTIEPRKNYGTLLKAWEKLHAFNPNLNLVIIGRRGWKNRNLTKLLKSTKNLVWLANACDQTLVNAYQNALFSINPSFAEGFNFPTLESKVFGCPTIVSDIAINQELHPKEIAFNPTSTDEMIQAINRQLNFPKEFLPRVSEPQGLFRTNLKSILLEEGII
jgi:glycosyltransferase involved in cell wall biosynthesis